MKIYNIQKQFEQQKSILFNAFLHRLLRGKISELTTTEDIIRFYGLQHITPHWAVVLFNGNFKNSHVHKEYNIIQRKDILSSIKYTLMDNIQHVNGVYMTEIDDMIAVLINTNEKSTEILKSICIASEVVLKEIAIYGLVMYSAVSDIYSEELQGISICYAEALEALEYGMMFDVNTVMSFNELGKQSETFEYTIEMEQKLINNIRSGDIDNTRNLLHEIFEQNISKNKIGLDMLKILVMDLLSTAIKAAGKEIAGRLIEDMQPARYIYSCKTIPEIEQCITRILFYVCEKCKENTKNRNESLCNDVMCFIQENYTNLSLSVVYISEKFELSSIYLSTVFSKCTGISILDYIHRCRVEKACELLRNTYKSSKEIASAVGYTDVNTFIRNFKKCKGITPGEYRRIKIQLNNSYV